MKFGKFGSFWQRVFAFHSNKKLSFIDKCINGYELKKSFRNVFTKQKQIVWNSIRSFSITRNNKQMMSHTWYWKINRILTQIKFFNFTSKEEKHKEWIDNIIIWLYLLMYMQSSRNDFKKKKRKNLLKWTATNKNESPILKIFF